MDYKRLAPIMEFTYPDRGGYTGLSILVWAVGGEVPGSYRLESSWGSADREAQDIKANYVMEARFFVFGSLLGYAVEGREYYSDIERIVITIREKGMSLMDKVIDTEKKLWKEEGRTGIHISEVVNDELRTAVKEVFENKLPQWYDCCDANKIYRDPDYTDGSYGEYTKVVSFRKAKKGDWDDQQSN